MMRLRDRLKNLLSKRGIFRGNPGIKTRHQIPLEVGAIVNWEYHVVSEEEKEYLIDNGYTREAVSIDKKYTARKYPKPLLEEMIDDKPDTLRWKDSLITINLFPINITSGINSDEVFNTMFLSLNEIFSFLAPFWFRKWNQTHHPLPDLMPGLVDRIRDTERDSEDYLIKLDDLRTAPHVDSFSSTALFMIQQLYNHPSMILSGVSIIQSIFAREFYRMGALEHTSEIFWTVDRNTRWDRIQDSTLVDSMNEEIQIRTSEGEKIPGIDTQYNNIKQVFVDILREYTRNTGTFKDRCSKLALSFWRDENRRHNPINNQVSLKNILDDNFSWENGPEVR